MFLSTLTRKTSEHILNRMQIDGTGFLIFFSSWGGILIQTLYRGLMIGAIGTS